MPAPITLNLRRGERNPKIAIRNGDFNMKMIFSKWDTRPDTFKSEKILFYNYEELEKFKFLKAKAFRPFIDEDHSLTRHIKQHIVLYTQESNSHDYFYEEDLILDNLLANPSEAYRLVHLHFKTGEQVNFDATNYENYIRQRWGAGPIIPETNNGAIIIRI